jgi:hypothetical protein
MYNKIFYTRGNNKVTLFRENVQCNGFIRLNISNDKVYIIIDMDNYQVCWEITEKNKKTIKISFSKLSITFDDKYKVVFSNNDYGTIVDKLKNNKLIMC